MATELHRFTISITPDMQLAPDAVKKDIYYKTTQNEMIRNLIARGLEDLKREQSTQQPA